MSQDVSRVGSYTIDREIGRGGMGVVYLGRDTRLDRDVAIKALPDHLAQDPDQLARFEREAKVLAQLTHPNIAAIHGVEQAEGATYLVLEYVEGMTLAERLDRGPLPLDEALEIACQVASGLEAAHDAGIIHRDLKPGNIKITPEGKVKVLDFGLARSEEHTSTSASSVSHVDSPTMTNPVLNSPTIPGAILGTAPYMSPEQARGRRVDKRTDVWSFGVVLYEMLTGVGPFHGETATDSIGAILHKDVDLERLPAGTPRAVRRVLTRCLERDRNQRLRDLGDARLELETTEQIAPAPATASSGPWKFVAFILLLALIVATGALRVSMRAVDPPDSIVRASIRPALGTTMTHLGDLAGPAVLSPSGDRVVFVARAEDGSRSLWVRALDEADSELLRGTEGASHPFWSADGRAVGFFTRGQMQRVDISTHGVRTICQAPGGRGGAWFEDGTIVFSPEFQSGLFRVSAEGGEPTRITTIDSDRHTSHRWPMTLPGGRVLFIAVNHDPGMLSAARLCVVDTNGGEVTELVEAHYSGQVVGKKLLFVRSDVLHAVDVDLDQGRVTGDAVPIVEQVVADLSTWRANFSAAEDGALIYHRNESSKVKPLNTTSDADRVIMYGRDGRPIAMIAEGLSQTSMSVSPDETTLAVSALEENSSTGFDIWLYPIPQPDGNLADSFAQPTRLTFMMGAEIAPCWSPDGNELVFSRVYGPSPRGVFRKRVGGGREELFFSIDDARRIEPEKFNAFETRGADPDVFCVDWTDDGKYILVAIGDWTGGFQADLWAIPVDGGDAVPLVRGDFATPHGEVSPDGRWLAFDLQDAMLGDAEVFVEPFAPGWEQYDEEPTEGARWRISLAGGSTARWNHDGTRLYYITTQGTLVEVQTQTENGVFLHDAGTPLFQVEYEDGMDFDVAPKLERYLTTGIAETRDLSVSLILNWQNLLGE